MTNVTRPKPPTLRQRGCALTAHPRGGFPPRCPHPPGAIRDMPHTHRQRPSPAAGTWRSNGWVRVRLATPSSSSASSPKSTAAASMLPRCRSTSTVRATPHTPARTHVVCAVSARALPLASAFSGSPSPSPPVSKAEKEYVLREVQTMTMISNDGGHPYLVRASAPPLPRESLRPHTACPPSQHEHQHPPHPTVRCASVSPSSSTPSSASSWTSVS